MRITGLQWSLKMTAKTGMPRFYRFSVLILCAAVLLSASFMTGCSGRKVNSIRFSIWESLDVCKAYKKLARRFMKENPGIHVIVSIEPDSALREKYMTQFSANAAPDVMQMHYIWIRDFITRGLLCNLDQLIASDPVWSWNDYFKLAVDSYKYRGNLFGVPMKSSAATMVYNKSLFEKDKVAMPNDRWTVADFEKAAKALTRDVDHDGRLDQFGYTMRTTWTWVMPWVWMNGGTAMNRQHTRFTFDNPVFKQVLAMRYRWYHEDHLTPNASDSSAFGGNWNMFQTGKIGMEFGGPWRLSEYRKIRDFEWDVGLYPIGSTGKRSALYGGTCYSIWSKSKAKKEAWKFIKFLASEESIKFLVKSGADIPPVRKIAWSDLVIRPDTPQHEENFVKAMEDARAFPVFENNLYIASIVNDELEKMLSLRKSPDKTAETINRLANAALREEQKK